MADYRKADGESIMRASPARNSLFNCANGISSSSSHSLSSSSSLRLGSITASSEGPAGVRFTSLSLRRGVIISSSFISSLSIFSPGLFLFHTLTCSTSLTGNPSNGIPVPFSFPYVLHFSLVFSSTETWESQSIPPVYSRVVLFGVVHLSPARAGSSQVTRSSTAPKPSLITTCRKVSDHATRPASQRSYSHWGHPASYFFTATTTMIFLEVLISDSPLDRFTATTVSLSLSLSLSTPLSSNAQVSTNSAKL
ncbi:unnamed protein product [Acanthosepion pharaonis]|uniref:Uncharacterized protein n=1 Tax=Acanthosepion pharaonis TaxID=158019 RepID=A0A812EX02_ACAPH|nr:unnamed protein product [Sepia pharaonis]